MTPQLQFLPERRCGCTVWAGQAPGRGPSQTYTVHPHLPTGAARRTFPGDWILDTLHGFEPGAGYSCEDVRGCCHELIVPCATQAGVEGGVTVYL